MLATILQDAIWSAVAALGFALLFNVPRRALLGCVITGAVGHAVRTFIVQQFGLSAEAGTLAGATVVGFLSKYFAESLAIPSLIFAVCGAIPMVPGVFAYNTMIGVLKLAGADAASGQTILVEAIINAVRTALILGAIAAGIALPTLLFQRNKPVT
jgi:uncharacterized membrane protein YjjB (DUF3815 family)